VLEGPIGALCNSLSANSLAVVSHRNAANTAARTRLTAVNPLRARCVRVGIAEDCAMIVPSCSRLATNRRVRYDRK
jgi:hypothetical protein